MKSVVFGILLTATLAMATPASDWTNHLMKSKLGRYTPATDQAIQDDHASTAYREDTSATTAAPNYLERFMHRKQGHYSQAEQARLDQEHANTAYRAEPAQETQQSYINRYLKRRLGLQRNDQ